MRVLVTGGCGFLGSHLVEHLLKQTATEIVILDKLSYASAGFDRLRDIQCMDDRRVRVLGCDLSQPIPAGIAQEVGAVDYVIHAAAETHVDHSITDPLPFLQSNVIGTHHLLTWMRGQPSVRRLFLVSTDEVYGPADWGHAGHTPIDPFRPANPYAASKAGAEAVAMAYSNTFRLPITIVNTMNLYGERQHPEKFIPLVIRKVLAGEEVTIHADPTRTRSGTRFYIHCRNYASALLWLLNSDFDTGAGDDPMPLFDKLHVAGEREISNLDLARQIAAFVERPLHYTMVDFHSSRPGHDLRYALDDREIRALGWRQPLDTAASLERTVRWYLAPQNRRWLIL